MESGEVSTLSRGKVSGKTASKSYNLTIPKLHLDISSSLADFLEKEQNILSSSRDDYTEVDVGSIIEEINRVAAQSPLGPYETSTHERSLDEIMKEAERIYMESSKSFEQLSQRSKTSQNISDLNLSDSRGSTPTPKSVSPLPHDDSGSDTYSEDFSEESKQVSPIQPPTNVIEPAPSDPRPDEEVKEVVTILEEEGEVLGNGSCNVMAPGSNQDAETEIKQELIATLEEDNKLLRKSIRVMKEELLQANSAVQQTKAALSAKSLSSPEMNLQLERTLEELKDSREINTALQLQLDTISKTHGLLKNSYDDLLSSSKNLERRVLQLDVSLDKYKNELLSLQTERDKLLENERNLSKSIEMENLRNKSLKLQNEKDAKCIQDLNRQIKEMERIIARKHPDSVSALIVAAKSDAADTNLTARKILEDRIRSLEQDAANHDTQSSRVFLDIQEKFNQMKLKYESHIEDLELHVNDLKQQLTRKSDTFDVYTQTRSDEKIPQKDTVTIASQTDQKVWKRHEKIAEAKEDAHLLATIRGLQADVANKEKVVAKLQRELDELKKTNRKLQKEREGSLKSLTDRREFRSYPEKLALQVKSPAGEDEVQVLKAERDKMKQQLCRIEGDFQALKTKRLHDLNALQEAHEREIATYVSNINPLREQLELQQVSLSTVQNQLGAANNDLIIVTAERDRLNNQLQKAVATLSCGGEVEVLQKKIAVLEKRYEERDLRLRTIVHELAQKNSTNRNCEQCTERQQQLIGYKIELDQLLATLRALKS